MARRLKGAVELVSDIGSKAFDLQHHSDEEIARAVRFLREVNGPMFDWLVSVLASGSPASGAGSHAHIETGAQRPRDASPESRADASTNGAK